MHRPSFVIPRSGELKVDMSNGHGYWYFKPISVEKTETDTIDPTTSEEERFSELPQIVTAANARGSLLLRGEPGSGKTHLISDLRGYNARRNRPTLSLTLHVNAGKSTGFEAIEDVIEDFRDTATEHGSGVLLTDNVDYIGYRGHSRSRRNAALYAASAVPGLIDMIEDPHVVAIATSHTNDWREKRWTWNDAAIDEPASQLVETFGEPIAFAGKMTLQGLMLTIGARTPDEGYAEHLAEYLESNGMGDFFHADHLPLDLFARDPEQAFANIHAGRQVRVGM